MLSFGFLWTNPEVNEGLITAFPGFAHPSVTALKPSGGEVRSAWPSGVEGKWGA